MRILPVLLGGSLVLAPLAAVAQKVELAKVLAPVEAVDLKNRILVIKTPRAVTALAVDKGVKGLDKIKPGQVVELEFYASTGNVVTTRQGEPVRTRTLPAPAKPKPGVAALRRINTVTDVYAVHVETRTVLVRGPLGHLTEVQLADVAALHTVKPGSRVELDYLEGVAMAVRPAAARK
jgi:hypothetical protein